MCGVWLFLILFSSFVAFFVYAHNSCGFGLFDSQLNFATHYQSGLISQVCVWFLVITYTRAKFISEWIPRAIGIQIDQWQISYTHAKLLYHLSLPQPKPGRKICPTSLSKLRLRTKRTLILRKAHKFYQVNLRPLTKENLVRDPSATFLNHANLSSLN